MEHRLMDDEPRRRPDDEPRRDDDPAEQGRVNTQGDRDVQPAERQRTHDPLARQSER